MVSQEFDRRKYRCQQMIRSVTCDAEKSREEKLYIPISCHKPITPKKTQIFYWNRQQNLNYHCITQMNWKGNGNTPPGAKTTIDSTKTTQLKIEHKTWKMKATSLRLRSREGVWEKRNKYICRKIIRTFTRLPQETKEGTYISNQLPLITKKTQIFYWNRRQYFKNPQNELQTQWNPLSKIMNRIIQKSPTQNWTQTWKTNASHQNQIQNREFER